VIRDSLHSAILEIHPENGTEERRTIPSRVHTFAHRWLTLITGERLPSSTVVGVEHNDVLFLGEVVRSTLLGNEQWALDIKVEQSLTGLPTLMILREQLEQHQTRSKDA
jgi:hypothetical protein